MENLSNIECCNCGILFSISSTFNANLKQNKQLFYCPNGHPQSYTKSTADILRERLDKKESEAFEKDIKINSLERDLNSAKKLVIRYRKVNKKK